MEFYYLDIELMERICHKMAVQLFDLDNDPIGPFNEHNKNQLDSAINNPKQSFDGKDLYPTLSEKAAILWYSINKNHPFSNGNKRISTASVLVFVSINNHWIDAGITEMTEKALYIANSKPEDREVVLKELVSWIESHLIVE